MKPRLLKDFDKSILRVKSSLFSRYGEEQSNNFLKCSREEYESLIPQIPYVGDKNPLLMFMLPTIRGLAIYRTILKFGGNVEDAGKLIYTISEKELQSIQLQLDRMGERMIKSRKNGNILATLS